jgi:hypothetical protein
VILTANTIVSEVIALHLKRPDHGRPYLYIQIYCGICYIVASACLLMVRQTVIARRTALLRSQHHLGDSEVMTRDDVPLG